MTVGSICTRKVTTITGETDLAAAAAVMRENQVGYLIVTEPFIGQQAPIGVLTDRDIVVKVVAKGVEAASLTVHDAMTRDPLVARESADIAETLRRMRGLGVRRVPVVGSAGQLTGVLSLDDVIDHLFQELGNVVGSMRNARRTERELHR